MSDNMNDAATEWEDPISKTHIFIRISDFHRTIASINLDKKAIGQYLPDHIKPEYGKMIRELRNLKAKIDEYYQELLEEKHE